MSDAPIAIDVSDKSDDEVFALINTARLVLYSGKGTKPLFGKWLDMDDADCLRGVLGAPREWFAFERKRFFEVAYAHQFDLPLVPRRDVWADNASWTPTNPRASTAPLSRSTLDLEFMEAFGFSDRAWDNGIFHSSGLVSRVKRGQGLSEEDKLRAYFGLAMIGFTNPEAFFVDA
ncbi:hypothetical protein [Salinisphaera orenii]|uniref:Uncharacterized protein n=1 Tax=Salinisphaera orenii YIM 95161 TaxID=1051139 RepID=A0A423PRR7_9GAMM|nr:hypothetical protein [Salinisphaera halophila]ROO28277.1 hypothetical protein SAHL_10815 [Salinisphaera halophila YIM 95161]